MTRLAAFLARTEWPDPTVGADEAADWPRGWLGELTAGGLLAPAPTATAVRCAGCDDDHVELVVWADAPRRPRRAFVPCPRHGRVAVDPERLRRWAVRFRAFAERVAEAGGFAGGVVELEADRAWRLGKGSVAGGSFVAYLARGLGWDDGPSLAARTPALQAAGSVVLVPSSVPAVGVWAGGPVAPVVSLTDALDFAAGRFVFDRSVLAAALPAKTRSPAATPARAFPTPAGAAWRDVRLVVGEAEVVASVGATTRRFRFDDIGFADRRKAAAPDLVWQLLLLIARHRGTIPSRSLDAVVVPDGVKQRVHILNGRLAALFQIDGPAVSHVKRTREYRAACAIAATTPERFPLPAGADWDDITMTERADHRIEITVAGGDARSAAAGDDASWTRRYTPAQLGLADAHDAPGTTGTAFLHLLRSGGRLGTETPERSKLALNTWLAGFFGLAAPFEIRPTGEWAARFGAASHAPHGH